MVEKGDAIWCGGGLKLQGNNTQYVWGESTELWLNQIGSGVTNRAQ